MSNSTEKPTVVLICHENDIVDMQGLASWLASSFRLAGMVVLEDRPSSLLKKLKRESKRVGLLRTLDVMLFRFFYRLKHAKRDQAWLQAEVDRLTGKYPADISKIDKLRVTNPNSEEARQYIEKLSPDFAIARCKYILRQDVFGIPKFGTYVFHPGVCPEYRNAHGCFWALAKRDLTKVGMTLLKVDAGIDTGPVYGHLSYDFDELAESHIVIQYRVVLENLDTIARTMYNIFHGDAETVSVAGRSSMVWGQPWLSEYFAWKRAARRAAILPGATEEE